MPLASVIIPTYGRPELAAQAAASALSQALAGGFDVHVVDDGGKDDTRSALARLPGLVKATGESALVGSLGEVQLYYHWKEHAGPAAARNLGARQAEGRVLAFLDSDTVADPGWLAAGVARLEAEREVSGVEGKVLPMEEVLRTPFTEVVENLNGGRWLTCNLFIHRPKFLELGGFDERFTQPCREDSEFAFRVLESGASFAFEPQAVVRHPVRETGPGRFFYHAREGRFEALIERRYPKLYRQHFKWIDGRAIPAYYLLHYVALGMALAEIPFSGACFMVGSCAVMLAWIRKRRSTAMQRSVLLALALLIPYVRLYWVLYGYFSYFLDPKYPDIPRLS